MELPKLKTLFRTLGYVYKAKPYAVILRETGLIIQVSIDVLNIGIWGKFIDATAKYLASGGIFNFYEYFVTDSFYFLLLATGLWLISFSIDRMRLHLETSISNYLSYQIGTDYFEKISTSNLQDIESKEFRDLITFGNKYGHINLWNTYKTFTNIVRNLVSGVWALVILLNGLGLWSLVIILFVVPESVMGYLNRKKIRKYQEKELERIKWIDYIENLMTRINHFSEMRVDGTFKNVKKEYSRKSYEFMKNLVDMDRHMQIDFTYFSVIGKILMLIYTIFIISISLGKAFTIGRFKALYDYSFSVYNNFFNILDMSFNISNFLEYNKKYFELIDFKGFGDFKPGNIELKKGGIDLELKDLDFQYPDGDVKTLENLNMEVKYGEKVMIIGDDSSGKSTLVKVLCGLYQIVAGDYVINGNSIRELARGELKKKISVVFQDYVNYNMTLKQNITLTAEEGRFDSKRFEKALDITGLKPLMKKLKISPNQILGKYTSGGKDVSPGFWQRLAIARAIYRNKEVLILDEPFTFIDDKEEEKILSNLFRYIPNKTIIYITRDNTHREFFDKIYRLEKGKLIKD